jgi:hypothetical protein
LEEIDREELAVIKRIIGAVAVAAAISVTGGPAFAEEVFVPHLSDVNGGAVTGGVPAEGWFFINTTSYISGPSYDTHGNSTPTNVTAFVTIPEIAWAPGIKILGANYLIAVAQPIDYTSLTGIGGAKSGFGSGGAFATVVTPARLGWTLPDNFLLAARTDVYIPDGGYNNPITHTVGNITSLDQFVFEPSLALSWLHDGWNISVKAYVDVNLQNMDNNYQSGNIFGTDDTVSKTFGKWTVGLTGFSQNQISNDTGSDVALINGPQAALDGHNVTNYGVGPLFGYNFGPVNFTAWYNQTFGTVNSTGGGLFFTSITVPLQ